MRQRRHARDRRGQVAEIPRPAPFARGGEVEELRARFAIELDAFVVLALEAVEFATLEWVDWFNNRRLLEPIGNLPPGEAEAAYYAQLELTRVAA